MARYIIFLLSLWCVPQLAVAATKCEIARAIITEHQKDPAGTAKINWMKKARKLCPEVHHTHIMYGMALEEFQDTKKNPSYDRVIEAYVDALKVKKHFPEAIFRIAGIKFIEGDFRIAAYYYRKYLKALPEDFADEAHVVEVEQYILKADWLNLVPGDIRSGALREDGAKARAAFRFIGETGNSITSSLYWAEGYTTGTGVGMLASGLITLIAQEPKVRYDLIERALVNQQWPKAYTLCLNNLRKVINLRGVEHQETYEMLQHLLISAVRSGQSPEKICILARVFTEWETDNHPKGLEYIVSEDLRVFAELAYRKAKEQLDNG